MVVVCVCYRDPSLRGSKGIPWVGESMQDCASRDPATVSLADPQVSESGAAGSVSGEEHAQLLPDQISAGVPAPCESTERVWGFPITIGSQEAEQICVGSGTW